MSENFMPIFRSGISYKHTQGLLELLWTVFSEEKLQSCLKLRDLQNPFHKKMKYESWKCFCQRVNSYVPL